ncbi:MAG: SoxR reducing system RseC family protein [Gammaproteobacteria bacterium]|nr:SoxR reducing system RseC family protein [Gammaproteobacteria bacterium]
MEESARILKVREGEAYVTALRQSSCGHCSARSGCGTSVLSRYIGRRSMEMWVDDPIGVDVNDEVVIQLHETGLFKVSLLFYLLPLILFIGFALLGDHITQLLKFNSEALVIVFAIVGLITAFMWLHRTEKKIIHDNRLRPVIIKRANIFPILPLSMQSDP